jgi:hypothetical protein
LEAYARASSGAAVIRCAGVASASSQTTPSERFYNNALLERDLAPGRRAKALKATVDRFAGARERRGDARRARGAGVHARDNDARDGHRTFRDPDGHLLEKLTMLDAEPRPDLGIASWSQWQAAMRRDARSRIAAAS